MVPHQNSIKSNSVQASTNKQSKKKQSLRSTNPETPKPGNCFELPSDWLLRYWESHSEGSSKQLIINSWDSGVSGFAHIKIFHLCHYLPSVSTRVSKWVLLTNYPWLGKSASSASSQVWNTSLITVYRRTTDQSIYGEVPSQYMPITCVCTHHIPCRSLKNSCGIFNHLIKIYLQ